MSTNLAEKLPIDVKQYDGSKMEMNMDIETIMNNVQTNIERFLPQVKSYPINKQKIVLVAGGPSLKSTFEDLQKQIKNGAKVVAVNNTHNWLLDRGIKPSAMVMVDARSTNVRFVQRPIASCKYMIASQCDPSVFDALEGFNTWVWHAKNGDGEEIVLDNYYMGYYLPIVGGSTVILRAIWLFRMLGFVSMDVYGFDSCLLDGKHHAYAQPENDNSEVQKVICAGKEFYASPWMLSQADDFMHFIKKLGEHFELNVHGNGLISHIIHEGAGYERVES